jgi:hypothetical protein
MQRSDQGTTKKELQNQEVAGTQTIRGGAGLAKIIEPRGATEAHTTHQEELTSLSKNMRHSTEPRYISLMKSYRRD